MPKIKKSISADNALGRDVPVSLLEALKLHELLIFSEWMNEYLDLWYQGFACYYIAIVIKSLRWRQDWKRQPLAVCLQSPESQLDERVSAEEGRIQPHRPQKSMEV